MTAFGNRYAKRVVPVLYGAIFAYFCVSKGIPGFRHDWSWPATTDQWISTWISSISGWVPNGYGTPHPYPTQYLVVSVLLPLALLLGSWLTLALFSLIIGWVAAWAASAIAGEGFGSCIAAGAFALFNPWVYTKLVSGHLMMIASYAASLALVALLLRGRTAWPLLWLCTAAVCIQIQFALIAGLIALLFITKPAARTILAAIAIVLLPSFVGIAADRSDLSAIPYLVAWQHSQSVPPLSAIALTGYFTHYADALPGWYYWLSFIIPALALAGFAFARRAPGAVRIALGTVAVLIFIMGDRGPLRGAYDQLVVTLHVSGVFRELYDLLAIVAIAYILLLRNALSIRPVQAIAAFAGITMAIAWFLSPPSQFWLDVSGSPHVAVDAPSNTRYALLPYLQPLKLRDAGSGSDPDVTYFWSGNVSALNAYSAAYPATTALGEYDRYGTVGALKALSVSRVYDRPALSSDSNALKDQTVQTSAASAPRIVQNRQLRAAPELALAPEAVTVSGVPGMAEDAIFFGDKGLGQFQPVTVVPASIDATSDWVDARFAFTGYPELGQPFGGAFTTSRAPLVLRGPQALVWVHGQLVNAASGRVLTKDTSGYQWLDVGDAVTVRCEGRCVVAATGLVPGHLPAHARAGRRADLGFHAMLPWLITATVPAGRKGTVIYNVRFNRNWTMLGKGHAYAHVRIAGIANGWVVPDRPVALQVTIINTAAFLQALAELAAALVVLYAAGVLLLGQKIVGAHQLQRQS